MKHFLNIAFFLLATSTFAQDVNFTYQTDYPIILARTNDPKDSLNYDKLLKRFQTKDTTMTDFEVLALMIGFTDSKFFKPYTYLQTEREIYSLNAGGKFREALDKSNVFMETVPLSQTVMLEKSYAFHKLNQPDSADLYMWQFHKIMEAMAWSGDGRSAETAIFAIGPADGQNFIKKYAGLGIGSMGSGRDKNGNFVDILEATWEDEETGEKVGINLYFQIQHASKTMFADLNFDDDKAKDKKEKKKKEK